MSGMEKSPKPLQIIKTVGVINTREKGARMNIYCMHYQKTYTSSVSQSEKAFHSQNNIEY